MIGYRITKEGKAALKRMWKEFESRVGKKEAKRVKRIIEAEVKKDSGPEVGPC